MRSWYPWYIACLLSLAQMISVLDRYLMSVALEPVKADLSLTDSQLGLLTGASFVILFTVTSIPLGRMADIASRRWIITLGVTGWSLSTISCAFTNSFGGLFLARLGVGLGEAALMPAAMSLIAAYFTSATRTKGVAIFSIGGSLGRAAAFMGGGALLGLFAATGGLALGVGLILKPWQGLFFAAGMLGLVVAALCLTIREPRRVAGSDTQGLAGSLSYFWGNRSLYTRFFLPYALVVGVVMGLAAWTVSIYVRKYGLSVAQASLIVGATSLVIGPLGGIFGGWVTAWLIRRKIMAAPIVVLLAALAVAPIGALLLCVSPVLWFTVVAYGLVYFAVSAAGPAGFGGVQMITPEDHRGLISSLFLCVYTLIGSGLGPLLVGLFTDYLFRDEARVDWSLATAFFLFGLAGIPTALSGRRLVQAAMQQTD